MRNTTDDVWFCFGKSVDSDSERAEGQEHVEEKIKEPLCLLASSEESTVMMTETETSEEAAESQKETNTDVIMQTSSDEEVKSRNNLTRGSKWISNII